MCDGDECTFVHSVAHLYVISFLSFLPRDGANIPSVANRTMPEMSIPVPTTVRATAMTTLFCLSGGIRLHSEAIRSMLVRDGISPDPILLQWGSRGQASSLNELGLSRV